MAAIGVLDVANELKTAAIANGIDPHSNEGSLSRSFILSFRLPAPKNTFRFIFLKIILVSGIPTIPTFTTFSAPYFSLLFFTFSLFFTTSPLKSLLLCWYYSIYSEFFVYTFSNSENCTSIFLSGAAIAVRSEKCSRPVFWFRHPICLNHKGPLLIHASIAWWSNFLRQFAWKSALNTCFHETVSFWTLFWKHCFIPLNQANSIELWQRCTANH